MIRIVWAHGLDPGVPGARVLVDRLWPRGNSRDSLALDGWLRDAAPSDELRRWSGHDPAREEVLRRYVVELGAPRDLGAAASRGEAGDVVLRHAARDREHDNAVLLRDHLEQATGDRGR